MIQIKSKKVKYLLIVIALIALMMVGSSVFMAMQNNRGATERRAYETAEMFVSKHKVDVERLTCAGDSDGDGFSTCNILTKANEKIILNCPSDYVDVKFWGATSCKELTMNMMIGGGPKVAPIKQ